MSRNWKRIAETDSLWKNKLITFFSFLPEANLKQALQAESVSSFEDLLSRIDLFFKQITLGQRGQFTCHFLGYQDYKIEAVLGYTKLGEKRSVDFHEEVFFLKKFPLEKTYPSKMQEISELANSILSLPGLVVSLKNPSGNFFSSIKVIVEVPEILKQQDLLKRIYSIVEKRHEGLIKNKATPQNSYFYVTLLFSIASYYLGQTLR